MKKKTVFFNTFLILFLSFTLFLSQGFAQDSTSTASSAQFGTAHPIPSVEKSVTGVNATMLSNTDTYTFKTTYTGAEALDSSLSTPSASAVENAQNGFTNGTYTTTIEGDLSEGSITKAILPESVMYTEPGIYEYTVQETACSNPNIAIDTNAYLLKVYVEYDTSTGDLTDSTLMIAGQEWYQDSSSTSSKLSTHSTLPITNKATNNTGTIKVSKTVEGTGADPNASFTFKVTFGGNYEGSYPLILNNDSSSQMIENGGTFTLSDGQSAQILNLPVGATVQLEETDAAGYTTAIDESQVLKSGSNTSSSYSLTSKTSDIVVIQEDNTSILAYTNTLNASAPTAFTFANMPFIYLGVGILAVAAVIFLITKNKKREEF